MWTYQAEAEQQICGFKYFCEAARLLINCKARPFFAPTPRLLRPPTHGNLVKGCNKHNSKTLPQARLGKLNKLRRCWMIMKYLNRESNRLGMTMI